jgi:very-short-patch-repair endonuclease
LASGWLDGNFGENDVCRALAALAIAPAFNAASPPQDCRQQYRIGPYTLDFAWPKLRIALEADGSAHDITSQLRRDRERDAWLRQQGWLVFRVDVDLLPAVAAQVARVVAVVRALARA